MPTENRRVAAYLPKEINNRFTTFKIERDIKGDSQALIVILSEFFGVAQQVAYQVEHQSNFATKDEIEKLNLKVAHLSEQIQGFNSRLNQVVSEAASELKNELLDEFPKRREVTEVSPGQLELLNSQIEEQDVELPFQLADTPSELSSLSQDKWITTREAFEALKPDCDYDKFRRLPVEKFRQVYGLQVDPQRKEKGKYNAKWLKLPATTDLPQASIESELPSESDSVTPDF